MNIYATPSQGNLTEYLVPFEDPCGGMQDCLIVEYRVYQNYTPLALHSTGIVSEEYLGTQTLVPLDEVPLDARRIIAWFFEL